MSFSEIVPYWTGDENSFDPQSQLEAFYYWLPVEHRLSMPYDLRDHFETANPDYNDQFVFFMLAFFDPQVPKTERQKIDLWFSALIAVLDREYAIWINKYTILCIHRELCAIFSHKSVDECQELFESLIPERVKRARLFRSIWLTRIIGTNPQPVRSKGFGF